MRSPFNREPKKLDDAIDRLYIEMNNLDPDTEEYNNRVHHLERLMAIKNHPGSWKPSPDAVVSVVGTAFVALIIVAYEQKHVMASKALGLIGKMKS